MDNELKQVYTAPELIDLGSLAEETKAGNGTSLDGSPEPPQAFFAS